VHLEIPEAEQKEVCIDDKEITALAKLAKKI
jgi:phosphoenolpyruvate synthase/pyruvate phosphate dikinase